MEIRHYQLDEFKKELIARGVKTVRRDFVTRSEMGSGEHPMDWAVTNLVLTAADGEDLFRYELIVHSVPGVFMNSEDGTYRNKLREKIEEVNDWLQKEFEGFEILAGVITKV